MGYNPVEKSEADEGTIAPKPSSKQIKNTLIEDNNVQHCLIEWKSTEKERWILASGDASFMSLDENI